MVRKITSGDYLKRISSMSASERQAFAERVGEWLRNGRCMLEGMASDSRSRLQNVLTASIGWNDSECEVFEEGALLLSALSGTCDTWLPDLLYKKAAGRSIRQMYSSLSAWVSSFKFKEDKVVVSKDIPVESEQNPKQAVGTPPGAVPASKPQDVPKQVPVVQPVPVRPRHIDQYVHLLPKKTQEHAAEVRDLLRQLDNAREKARLLMESPQASPDSRAQWAKKAVEIDDRLRSIYKELDAEWEKLVNDGRITIDIFGNAHVVEVENGELKIENSQGKDRKPELTSEQKSRRRELRKWLIDTRRGAEGKAREKRIEQWKVNIREYLSLEPLDAALKDEKLVAAARHYGIEIKPKQSE